MSMLEKIAIVGFTLQQSRPVFQRKVKSRWLAGENGVYHKAGEAVEKALLAGAQVVSVRIIKEEK